MSITINDLIKAYTTDTISPYQKLRHRTRINYDSMIRRISAQPIIENWLQLGHVRVCDLKARSFLKLHLLWTGGGRNIPMAHGLMRMIRGLVSYGVTYLEDDNCARLSGILHGMRFEMGKSRDQELTAEMAIAVRARAHREGLPMIALAQALQFEGTFRQKDIIGEWCPFSEPGVSEVVHRRYEEKWLRGVRWSEIDDNLILRHVTSKKLKLVEVDLKLAPMVIEEFGFAFCDLGEPVTRAKLPASGPIIVDPDTGIPFLPHKFRRQWRRLARLCGIPDDVQNRDSRAGAITEATDAGADLESVRHAAAHSNVAMTARYSRGAAKKTAAVMKQRAAHRARGSDQDAVA